MSNTKRFRVLFSVCVGAAASCSKLNKQEIGDRISGPFGLVTANDSLFVLNSAYTGEYADGNLIRYAIGAKGELVKNAVVSLQRLGIDIAASADGKLIAVSFAGTNTAVKFFKNDDNLSPLAIEFKPEDIQSIKQIKFFDAGTGDYWLTGTSNSDLSTSKVFTLRIAPSLDAVTKVFQIPEDLPEGIKKEEFLGFASPVYLKSQNLLVSFPRRGKSTFLNFPATADFIANSWDKSAFDLRRSSLLVTDFSKIIEGKSIAESSIYVPIAFNRDGNLQATDAEGVESFSYQYNWSSALALDQNAGCTTWGGGLDSSVVLAASNNNNGEVIGLSGWAALKAASQAVLGTPGSDWRSRIFQSNLVIKIHSKAYKVPELDGVSSQFSNLGIVTNGAHCQPVWARTELNQRSLGSEIVRLQSNIDVDPGKPVNFGTAEGLSPGAQVFAASKSFVFSASYSKDTIQTLEWNGSGLKLLP